MLHHRFPLFLMCICLCSLAVLGVSCRAKEVELSFETIERADQHPYPMYEGKDPKVTVIYNTEGIDRVEGEVTPALMEELQQLDYDKHIALVVFQGRVPEIRRPPAVEVTKVACLDGTLRVYARFHQRATREVAAQMVNSPCQTIRIARKEVPTGEVEVLLIVDNEVVARDTAILKEED